MASKNRGKGINAMVALMAKIIGGGFVAIVLSIVNTPGMLLAKVKDSFGGDVGEIDEAFVTQFACALYHVCISYSYEVFAETGGVFNFAWNVAKQMPDKCSPAAMLAFFQEGFGIHSQTMKNSMTEAVIIKVGKLLLADWLINGEPDEATMKMDVHGYFDVALEDEGIVLDQLSIKTEAKAYVETLSPDELAEFPADLLERIRNWQPQDDSDKAE